MDNNSLPSLQVRASAVNGMVLASNPTWGASETVNL